MSDGRYPILTDYDLGERVDLIVWDAGLGMFLGNVPTVGLMPLGGAPAAVTLDAVQAAVAPAVRDHGANTIDWAWNLTAGNNFVIRDNTNGDAQLQLGPFAHLAGRRGDGEAALFARSAAGAVVAQVKAVAQVAQPNANMTAVLGAAQAQVEVRTTGVTITTTAGATNGVIMGSSNYTFRDIATSPAGEILQLGPGLLSLNVKDFLRINNAAPGTGPSVFSVGAGANIPITLVPKGTSSVQMTRATITADNGQLFTGQTDGAGVAAGTLNNAPTAGDPAFWLRVQINGANRFIPAWA